MALLEAFDKKWSQKIRSRREIRFLAVCDVCAATALKAEIVIRAETSPSRVPLCDLGRLIDFYGFSSGEIVELCTVSLKRL